MQWGDDEKAPETPIRLAQDGQRLEALPPGKIKLPITLTLRIEFPGHPPNVKSELFTFPFSNFSPDSDNPAPQTGGMAATSSDHSGSTHTTAPQGEKSADTLEHHPAH